MTRTHATPPPGNMASGEPILVAGDPDLAGQLTQRGLSIVTTPDVLQALGELSVRIGGGRAPVTILLPMAQLGREVEPTLRAIRVVAPAAGVILIAEAAEEPEAMRAVRLGADDYHIRPLHLDRLIDSVTPGASASPDASEPPETPDHAASAAPEPASFGPPEANGKGALGDALCSQLLEDLLIERPLRQRLLDHLTAMAGGDVQLVAEPPIERAGDAAAVRINGHHFGYLISDAAPASHLAGHATEIARWLAVERRIAELKELAYKDQLTGAWSRRYFDKAFRSILHHAADHRFRVTLLLFDIDDFKHYNDTYGHPAGDEILIQCARLMHSVVRKHDIVARIGGDEFAVIFWDAEGPRKPNSEHPHSIRRAAARFQRAICEHRFPKLGDCAPGTLTISGGLASFPWDGRTVEDLIAVADRALLASKKQGKNVITFGDGADQICADDAAE